MECNQHPLSKVLISRGWKLSSRPWTLEKGSWEIVFDTSSWLELSTPHTPRLFDIPVPKNGLETWTAKLIEHLFLCDDKLKTYEDK